MINCARFSRFLASLVIAILFTMPAHAWPPGGNGNGNGGGGNGGGNGGGGESPPPPAFVWTEITPLPGAIFDSVIAWDLNNHGDVVGQSPISTPNRSHAFLNAADGNGGRIMIDLHDAIVGQGLLPTASGSEFVVSSAQAINDAGQIVLAIFDYEQGTNSYIKSYFLYTPPGVDDGTPIPARLAFIVQKNDSNGIDLNEAGVVAGQLFSTLFVWDEVNGFESLPPHPDFGTTGVRVNLAGEMSLLGFIPGTAGSRALRYSPDDGIFRIFNDRTESSAGGINELGVSTGAYRKSKRFPSVAFRYSPFSGIEDLDLDGRAGSRGVDINNLGDVAGRIYYQSTGWEPALYMDEYGFVDVLPNSVNPPAIHHAFSAGRINDWREFLVDERYLVTTVEPAP